ncbi:MAG: penicillin-binding protein [Flavobacteriales bacterium]
MKNVKNISLKVWIMYLLISLLGVSIAVKVFAIQFFEEETWEVKAQESAVQTREIKPSRGQIFSSDKLLLATSISEYEVRWDSDVPNMDDADLRAYIDSACYSLATLFPEKPASEFRADFIKGLESKNRYQLIKRDVDFLSKKEIQNMPFFNLGRFKSGFIFVEKNKREKPLGKLAQRTIGIHREGEKVGLERAYDSALSGRSGQRLEEKIAGNVWKPITDDYIIEPVEGADVISSIHSEIQDVATTSLESMLQKHDCEWGVAIVMEVETGYIRAMTNLSKNKNSDSEIPQYSESMNHAILTRTEPGSTFKLPSLLAAIDEGLIDLSDSIATGNGVKKFYGKAMKDSDWDKGGSGTITVEQCFEKSSNVGCALALQRAYKKNPQAYLDKLSSMGVYNTLDLKFKGENPPIIKANTSDKGWSGLSLTQMAIGYEVQYSPLQTLSFYNTIANNGRMMKPLFAEALSRRGEVFENIQPQVLHEKIVSNSTIDAAKQMMEGVVTEGTARKVLKNEFYTAAGKTGTAWAAVNGSYVDKKYQASFCGYFPAEAPKYSCIVVVFNPQSGAYYGSALAAPVFRDISDMLYAKEFFKVEKEETETEAAHIPLSKDGYQAELNEVYSSLGMEYTSGATDATWVFTETKPDHVNTQAKSISKNTMPYVVGMGLKDALYLLESMGLQVELYGHGVVRKQSIKSGTSLETINAVSLELSHSN